LREKYCRLVDDKPDELAQASDQFTASHANGKERWYLVAVDALVRFRWPINFIT
jgi:hypothetical protein